MTTNKRRLLEVCDADSYEHGLCYSIDVDHLGHAIEWTIRKECPGCDGSGCLADWDPRVTHRCGRCLGTGVTVDYHQWPLSVGALWMVFDEAFDLLAVDKLNLTDEERGDVAVHEDGRARAEGRVSRSHLFQGKEKSPVIASGSPDVAGKSPPQECSICRGVHGREIVHACE